MIKPDGYKRGLSSLILNSFENKGFKLVALKQVSPNEELIKKHYGIHKDKPFFSDLVNHIKSGPIIVMVWQGLDVVERSRILIGDAKPIKAALGSIRGDFGIDITKNVIHGSDSVKTAKKSINLWFGDNLEIDYNNKKDILNNDIARRITKIENFIKNSDYTFKRPIVVTAAATLL